MNTTRQCRVCLAVRPLEDFPYARLWRIHTCIDCHRQRNAAAQKRYYRNGGKAKRYAWFEAQGGQGAYYKRMALERRLKSK